VALPIFRREFCALSRWLLLALVAPAYPLQAQTWYTDAYVPTASALADAEQPKDPLLRLGPVLVDVSASTAVEYTDNLALSPQPAAGLSITEGLGFGAQWQAAQSERLNLIGSLTRVEWAVGHAPDRGYVVLEPGSAFSYSIYVKEIRITPFLNVSQTFDPVLAPTVNDTTTFEQSTYDLGVQVDVPCNGATAQLIALRGLALAEGGDIARIDTDRRLVGGRLVRELGPELSFGGEFDLVAENFRHAPSTSARDYSGRLFGTVHPTESCQLTASAGVDSASYFSPALAGDSPHRAQAIGSVAVSQQLREHLSCALSFYEKLNDNVSSDYYRVWAVALTPKLVLNASTVVYLESRLQHLTESVSGGEVGYRWDNEARVEVAVSRRLQMRLGARSSNNEVSPAPRAYRKRDLFCSLDFKF